MLCIQAEEWYDSNVSPICQNELCANVCDTNRHLITATILSLFLSLSLCLSHAYYSLFSMLVAIFSVAYSFWTMSHLYNGIAHYFVRFLCTHFPIAIDNTTIHLIERMCMCVLCMFSIFRMHFIRSLFHSHTHTLALHSNFGLDQNTQTLG